MSNRWIFSIVIMLGTVLVAMAQQGPRSPALGTPGSPGRAGPTWSWSAGSSSCARIIKRRSSSCGCTYKQVHDEERAAMAEEELKGWHRIRKHAFIEDLDTPPPTLHGDTNIVEANNLLTRALIHKNAGGWGTDYIDNQRRAEILLQELLTKYPQSNKISVAAYWLGDIYEGKANEMYRRAAWYYTRCYQWNPSNNLDARLRAARIYDHKLNDKTKALELYREVENNEHTPAHREEAKKRITELTKR